MGLSEHLRLFGDDTRLRILHLLRHESLTVAELQEVLGLSQSSVSGHLGKLKRAGILHHIVEGSSHRYRLREDTAADLQATWEALAKLSGTDPRVQADQSRLQQLRHQNGTDWVNRIAGSLHRAYAPGRNWDAFGIGLLHFARLGICADIGSGDGALLPYLAPQAEHLYCIDPHPVMREAAHQRAQALQLDQVSVCDCQAEQLSLADQSCDSALFLQSLQYVVDPQQAIAEAHRILKPGGSLLIATLVAHSFSESKHYGHIHQGFSVETLQQWMVQFSTISVHLLEAEGRPPHFQSVLITAQKT